MAQEGRALCVRGLPAQLEPERLADKLLIHFLRSRNGGGEVSALKIRADRSAVITFEDSKVALKVLSHCPHILEVDGREYELSLSLPGQEASLLNKVILDMSATIDCSQLPLREKTVKSLCEKYPDLHVQFTRPQNHCTVHGLYSEVQAVVSELVELLGDSDPLRTKCASSGRQQIIGLDTKVRSGESLHRFQVGGLGSTYQEAEVAEIPLQTAGEEGKAMDLHWAKEQSEGRKGRIEEADVEVPSLIMEADVFSYLRSRSEQYKRILLSHGVHIVDATSDGVTTLYLQSDATVKTRSDAERHRKRAHEELSQLCQQLEGKLRRDQVLRSTVELGGNSEAVKELQSVLPKVLLTYDQTYVYIVGESSDVSLAKQVLLLGSGNGNELSPTAMQRSYSSTSEEEATQLSDKMGRSRKAILKTNRSTPERRVKRGEDYKLAARFKNSEIGLSGFYPGERGQGRELRDLTASINTSTLASNFRPTAPSKDSRGTAGAASGVLSGGSQVTPVRVSSAQRTDDVLFNSKVDPFSFGNTFKPGGPMSTKPTRTKSTEESTSTLQPRDRAPPSTSKNSLPGLDTHGLSAKPSTPRSSLRRANSFSGRPSPKTEALKSVINERSRLSTGTEKRAQTSRVINDQPAEEPAKSSVSGEVMVSTVMWNYMKETYRSYLDGLIADLQVTEIISDKAEVKLILKGPEPPKVEECKSKLQKLISMIASDFRIQELQLADIGVTEGSEAFKACCSNIRSSFSKLSVQSTKDTVLLIGPAPLCSRGTEMLKEVFFREVLNSVPQVSGFTYPGTLDEGQAQFQSGKQFRPNQTEENMERIEGHGTRLGGSQSESWNVIYTQSLKRTTSVTGKEKAKDGGPGYLETSRNNEQFRSQSSEVSEVRIGTRDDWPNHPLLTAQSKQNSSSPIVKQTSEQVCEESELCVRGESEFPRDQSKSRSDSKGTKSGDSSQKALVHQAADEPEGKDTGEDPKLVKGIQGSMTYVELPLSLPGYGRYTTAKITYCIPDGIQGDEDPNPGSPFEGGVFEAYLPLSSVGRDLLPCMKKAFKQGVTFRVCPSKKPQGNRAQIWWYRIPHKTRMDGGKSGNGYPDSTYLSYLSEALKACGIKEDAALTAKS